MIWLLLLSLLPPPVLHDSVDIAELNHVCCPTNGNEQGAYWVWWRWQTVDGISDYYVADWRRQTDAPRPREGVQEFWDAKFKVNRVVTSKVLCETWTSYDRESEDRKRLPESRRHKLRQR